MIREHRVRLEHAGDFKARMNSSIIKFVMDVLITCDSFFVVVSFAGVGAVNCI